MQSTYILSRAAELPGQSAHMVIYSSRPTHVKTHKLLQVCSQAVNKLCSHCLFPVVVTSLEQAGNKLDGIIRLVAKLF